MGLPSALRRALGAGWYGVLSHPHLLTRPIAWRSYRVSPSVPLSRPPPPPHSFHQVPGGAPALLTGPITLCGRSDLDADRFFTGSLSNLMLFDTSLQPEQVRGGMGGRGGAGWRGEGPT